MPTRYGLRYSTKSRPESRDFVCILKSPAEAGLLSAFINFHSFLYSGRMAASGMPTTNTTIRLITTMIAQSRYRSELFGIHVLFP